MSDLFLKTLQVSDAPEVIIQLPEPAAVSATLDAEARLAADGKGPAPQVGWAQTDLEDGSATPQNLRLTLLGQSLEVSGDKLTPLPSVCVRERRAPDIPNERGFEIVSGSITIETTVAPLNTAPLWGMIWPPSMVERFGNIERLLVSVALVIETVQGVERRRFQLVSGSHVEPSVDSEVRLTWRQVAWRDQLDDTTHRNPQDRVQELQGQSNDRLARTGPQPVRQVAKFDGLGDSAGSVIIQVRLRKNPGDTSQTLAEAREVIAPDWALALGGADWTPRSLTVVGHPLDAAVLRYSDSEDAFDEPAESADELQTQLQWEWADANSTVIPVLTKLATSPPLLSTGELPGAGDNRPFLWQMSRLVVDGPTKTVEPSVWIRYQLDSLLERENARSRRDDVQAGLSRPIRIDQLRRTEASTVVDEPWRLDLGLLPDQPILEGAARLWLEVGPNSATERTVDLILAGARIHAATPHLRALATSLADPAAVPNRHDLMKGLNPMARMLLANDVELPPQTGEYVRAVQATHKSADGLRLNAWNNNHDVAVAYVAGPLAGIDLVSRTRGNLNPLKSDLPNQPPSPELVREFLPGRVAVHLLANIDLSSAADATISPSGEVRVGGKADLFLPKTEAVVTLLPSILWRVKQDSFDAHEFEPLHHNAALEAFDWAVSAPDRYDPQPSNVSPSIDFEAQETKPRDFSHEEAQRSLARAVRDRFSQASETLTIGQKLPCKNWLDQVELQSVEGTTVTPQIEIKLPNPSALTETPQLLLSWHNTTTSFSGQALALTPSPGLDADALNPDAFRWFDAWLRWLDPQPETPLLRFYSDKQQGRHAARHAAHSDVPILEHRMPIRAITAAWLNGRNWVIFATGPKDLEQILVIPPKLFAWEPLSGTEPFELTGFLLEAAPIDHLAADSSGTELVVAVGQGSKCRVLHFIEASDKLDFQKQDLIPETTPLAKINSMRLAAQRLFLGYESQSENKTFLVYEVDGSEPVSERVSLNLGTIRAMDVRGDAAEDAEKISVAVATDTKVQLFQWKLELDDAQPLHGPTDLVVNLEANETIEAVVIQPLTFGIVNPPNRVFAYAATRKGDQPGRLMAWKLAPLPLATPLPPLDEKPADLQVLQLLNGPMTKLITDPGLDDDSKLEAGIPLARWLIGTSAASLDGKSSLAAWPVRKWPATNTSAENIDKVRPEIGAGFLFGDHEGEITDVAVVPGRQANAGRNLEDSRLGAWIVTAGADGTVRVWDPETGLERYRHTHTDSGAWLDTLGVVRTPLAPIPERKVDGAKVEFWVEPISVPDDLNGRKTILLLSTLGDPIDLVGDSLPHSSVQFACQHFPLQLSSQADIWEPVSWDYQDEHHRWQHGVFGCNGRKVIDDQVQVPKLAGIPIEIISLFSIKLENFSVSPWPISGNTVTPAEIVLDAILANPAEDPPRPDAVRLDVQAETIRLRFVRSGNGFTVSVDDQNSRFDWRFPLTNQLSSKTAVLPGRLVRLAGKVSLQNSRWHLSPESSETGLNGEEQLLSQAEALGRLRKMSAIPELVFDSGATGGEVKFREKDTQAQLARFGNQLPKPTGLDDAELVDAALGTDSNGDPVALLATHSMDDQDAAVLAESNTGRQLTNYMDGLRRARLVVDETHLMLGKQGRWISVVGIAFDGTIRTRRLWKVTQDEASGDVEETAVVADKQEWTAYALPSPVEDVQVLDAEDNAKKKRRLMLARCRDGSAWLLDAVTSGYRHEVSITDTAVTSLAFGPPVLQDYFDITKMEYQPWRDFFLGVATQLGQNLLGVFALGGVDGSIRVYAIDKEDKPVLVRSIFELDAPLQSLSITIDEKSLEAGKLGRGRAEPRLPGLVLLGCDGVGPAKLIEILSGHSLIDATTPSVNNALKPETTALRGQVLFAEKALRVILQVAGEPKTLLQLSNITTESVNDFSTNGKELAITDIDTAKDLLITTVTGEAGAAVSEAATGWAFFELDGTLQHKQTVIQPVVDISIEQIFSNRYLVGVLPNGALKMWKATLNTPGQWVLGPAVGTSTQVDKAALGRAVIPLVACRGPSDQVGHCWSADLWEGSLNWPEAIGPVADDWPVALTSLKGAPHLAVGRPGDVTVWNLETGRLVHRVGVDSLPIKLDAASEFDEVWLLIATKSGSNTTYSLVNSTRQSAPNDVVTAPTANVEARLFTGPAGLELVTLKRNATPKLEITANHLEGPTVTGGKLTLVPTQTRTIDDVPGSLAILDFTSFADGAPWLLARATVDATNRSIVAVSIAAAALGVNTLTPDAADSPLLATFDLDPDPTTPNRPLVLSCNTTWTQLASWALNEATTGPVKEQQAFTLTSTAKQNGADSDTQLAAIRSDGRTRLVAIATGGLAVWDITDQELVRTEKLDRADPRLAAVTVAAVMMADANANCVRIWDQNSGRLRQRLIKTDSTRLNDLSKPSQLATVSATARPRLVVSGDETSTIIELDRYRALASVKTAVTSLTAALATPATAGEPHDLVIAGIVDTPQRQINIWRGPVGVGATLTAGPLEETVDTTVKAVSLIQLSDRTLVAHTQGAKLTVREVAKGNVLRSILALPEDDVLLLDGTTDQVGETLHLSEALEKQCLLAAVRLRSTTGSEASLVVVDLPLRATPDNTTVRPLTRWQSNQQPAPDLVATTLDPDGVLILAGDQAFRARPLLRVGGNQPPRFDLPVRLLDSEELIQGRITPAYRLDLEIPLKQPKQLGFGLHKDLHTRLQGLRAHAVLVQSTYSCFLLDSIEHDTFRLSGALVLWEDETAEAHQLRGIIVLEDSYPTPAAEPSNKSFGAITSITLPKADGTTIAVEALGPRVRFRAIPFVANSGSLETLAWREILTWNLTGTLGDNSTGRKTQWHLSEVVFDRPAGATAISQQAIRTTLARASDSVQGDVIVSLKRESNTNETYTVSVEHAVYVAQAVSRPQRSQFGTTRDDVVYSATPGSSVGLAFDLVEQANTTAPFQLVTPLVANTGDLELVTVNSGDLPLELSSGGQIFLPLPTQPIQVPQLVHREAHGARLRARWFSLELLPPPKHTGKDLLTILPTNSWLLAPLARTPQGVRAMTMGLLISDIGQPLDWTRLQTENVLVIYDHGGSLFSSQMEGSQGAATPSVLNLLTNTVLAASGSTGQQQVFDDKHIQSHALRTGLKGVLLARTSEARGRVSFRFVNSPYHSLIPKVTKRRGDEGDVGVQDTLSNRVDARLLSPQAVSMLATLGTPRYQPHAPTMDRLDMRAFRRLGNDSDPDNSGPLMVHFGDVPAFRGATRSALPLHTSLPLDMIDQTLRGFLPTAIELGYGLGKPGGTVSQLIRCLSTNKTGILRAAPPTEFARREPQRLTPPTRAAIQLQSSSIKLENGSARVEVAWKEFLGFVPFENSAVTGALTIEEPSAGNFTIPNAAKAIVVVTRLGEQVRQIPLSNSQDTSPSFAVPITPFVAGLPVEGFDLVLVTGVNNLKSVDFAGEPFEPFLVVVTDEGTLIPNVPAIRLTDVMTESPLSNVQIWRLKQDSDQSPVLLNWLSPITDFSNIFLNLVWSKDLITTSDHYRQAAKLNKNGIRLRDAYFLPQAPRLSVAIRAPNAGLLPAAAGFQMREFTLFDGPSASAKGVSVNVQPETSERSRIQFESSDVETVILADPLAQCGLFVVKIFEDGSTLFVSETLAPQ